MEALAPEEYVLRPEFMEQVLQSPHEGFYLVIQKEKLSEAVFKEILRLVLFLLPVQRHVYFLPNPMKRFCLDLRQPSINWLAGKKMRRHLSEFELSVKFDLAEDLHRCVDYHKARGNARWLSDELINDLHEASVRRTVPLLGFSLVDRATGTVAASSFGR